METKENTRVCYECGVEKDLTAENFHRSKLVKHGFDRKCKSCKSEYDMARPSRTEVSKLKAKILELEKASEQDDFLSKLLKS